MRTPSLLCLLLSATPASSRSYLRGNAVVWLYACPQPPRSDLLLAASASAGRAGLDQLSNGTAASGAVLGVASGAAWGAASASQHHLSLVASMDKDSRAAWECRQRALPGLLVAHRAIVEQEGPTAALSFVVMTWFPRAESFASASASPSARAADDADDAGNARGVEAYFGLDIIRQQGLVVHPLAPPWRDSTFGGVTFNKVAHSTTPPPTVLSPHYHQSTTLPPHPIHTASHPILTPPLSSLTTFNSIQGLTLQPAVQAGALP